MSAILPRTEHQLTVSEVYRNLPASVAVRARDSLRQGCQHRRERRAGRLLRREDRPLARRTSGSSSSRIRRRTSGGDRSTSPATAQTFAINRERAIDYLNTRERLYCVDGFAGWDPKYRLKVRVICARPYHALFMHNMLIRPTPRGAGELRRARLRDLQRRRVPGQPPHRRHDLDDEHRAQPRGPRDGHPRHRVRRRDEEGRVHDHELPGAEARRAVDALLGHGGPADRAVVAPVRPVRHRQDDALGRSEAPAHRRRRALLERRRHLQHRRRLLRQGRST